MGIENRQYTRIKSRGWLMKESEARTYLQRAGSVLGALLGSRTCPPLCGMSVRLVCVRVRIGMKERSGKSQRGSSVEGAMRFD